MGVGTKRTKSTLLAHRQILMDEIIDHGKTPGAVNQRDDFYSTRNGNLKRWETTKGWGLCVQWKDGSSSWVTLKDLKNSYPVETAEYAAADRMDQYVDIYMYGILL